MDDFNEFASSRYQRLVRASILLGCSELEAEDLVQEALVRALVSWKRVQTARDPDAYVYRILVNVQRKQSRRLWRGERPTDPSDLRTEWLSHPSDCDDADTILVVRAALMSLSAPLRAVIVLRHFADLSERQTADVLGIPTGTVKSRLSAANAKLAALPAIRDLREGTRHAE